jgi:hypothetical protein
MLNKDSLVSDFSYLVQLIESTHPDPYNGFGGKVFFHEAANGVINDLYNNPCTQTMFVGKVNAFLSNIHDGHTLLQYAQSANTGRYAQRIGFRVIPEGVIVDGISTSHRDLLGARLDSINGVAFDELVKRTGNLSPCENIYGNYEALHWGINGADYLHDLGIKFTDAIRYSFHDTDGKPVSVTLPLVSEDSLSNVPITFTPADSKVPYKNLNYQFTDREKRTMIIRVSSIKARENYEYCLKNKWDGAYNDIKAYYKYTLKKEIPSDTIKALAGIPSFSENFANMLKQMKKYKSSNLIIDLRQDQGGWTPIVLPSLLMLYGDDYVTKDMNAEFYTLISPLYLHKINMTLDKLNQQQGTHYKLGDYISENDTPASDTSVDSLRNNFIKDCMSATRPLLTRLKGKPLYHPQHIYVVTDAGTFSAAFHYAFYLWRMGATVVGVPSSQAPNTFMENTPFSLPYTHLSGSISNCMQVFLPSNDKRAKIFYPDMMPTYQDYKKYNFDANAEILYLLDSIDKVPGNMLK